MGKKVGNVKREICCNCHYRGLLRPVVAGNFIDRGRRLSELEGYASPRAKLLWRPDDGGINYCESQKPKTTP
jgi:hypothetical protein